LNRRADALAMPTQNSGDAAHTSQLFSIRALPWRAAVEPTTDTAANQAAERF
jgi:hypothetical protein